MRFSDNACAICRLCILLLLCQWVARCPDARGQLFVPSPSYTVPSDDSPRSYADSLLSNTADFVITVRTSLLAEFVNGQTVRSGNVATQVMGANVRGVQTTTTSVRLQSQQNADQARLNIVTQGAVSSNTLGLTPQARIATVGNHTFNITKPVYFDGTKFLTKQAYGSLQVQQFPQVVDTVASGLPLIGRIGNRVAWNELQRRKPTTDAIVARQVADDVLPEVNRSVDESLADLNRSWRSLRTTLDRLSGSDQIMWSASSTPDSFSTSSRNGSIASRAVQTERLSAELAPQESLAVVLSQEGANRWLGRLPLAGATLSDTALQQIGEVLKEARERPAALSLLFGQGDLLAAEPQLFSIRFATVEPLALEFSENLLTVRSKFQIIPKVGEPGVMQSVAVRLAGQSEGDDMWSIAVKDLAAEPASRNEQPDIYTNLINSPAVASQIPRRNCPEKSISRNIIRRFRPSGSTESNARAASFECLLRR